MEKPKEKKHGKEYLLQENDGLINELNEKKERHWISEEEYRSERARLEEERLEILTQPD